MFLVNETQSGFPMATLLVKCYMVCFGCHQVAKVATKKNDQRPGEIGEELDLNGTLLPHMDANKEHIKGYIC